MQFPTDGIERVKAISEHGRLEMAMRAPIAALRPYVRGYCLYDEGRLGRARQQHLPSRDVTFIIGLAGTLEVHGPGEEGCQAFEEGRGFLAGIHTRPAITEARARQAGIQISLTPIGAHRLLGGRPMNEVSDRTCSLDALLGRPITELADRLSEATDDTGSFSIVDDFFGERMLGGPTPLDPHVVEAWRLLEGSHGRLRIGEIAARLRWSRKRLVARFREQIGHPPKTIARILRFDHAMELLKTRPDLRWSDVAFDCGYTDQAHLTRDVRDLTGQTPVELAARLIPESGGMAAA
jgi:AraC-like DNA-binding protein